MSDTTKPSKVYRGSRYQVAQIVPQTIPPGDRKRYPEHLEKIVFASPFKTEAQIYALFSNRGSGGFSISGSVKPEHSLSEKDNYEEMEDHIVWKIILACVLILGGGSALGVDVVSTAGL